MAIGWTTLLSLVPWKDVIANAPKVADGAMKLWKSVAGKPVPAPTRGSASNAPATAEALTPVAMEARIRALESEVTELRGQMVSSVGLVKQLAEQNSELVRRIEVNRVRTLWLALIAAGGLIAAIVALSGQA